MKYIQNGGRKLKGREDGERLKKGMECRCRRGMEWSRGGTEDGVWVTFSEKKRLSVGEEEGWRSSSFVLVQNMCSETGALSLSRSLMSKKTTGMPALVF
jgi:hypothetical protein